MMGIYKITSPNNRIYVGQSKDIDRRWEEYKNINNVKLQIKLYRSFMKYGIINHKFEIIEECDEELLNNRERYWQEYYNVLEGLNCFLTNTDEKPRINSKEYNLKISETLKEKYKLKKIIHYNQDKGIQVNIYDYTGKLLQNNLTIPNATKYLNLANRSILNTMLRKNRFLSQKQYIIIPVNMNYYTYLISCIKLHDGKDIPIYKILKDNTCIRITGSQSFHIRPKILNEPNCIYYSKKSKFYYTFMGLINNAVLERNL